MKMKFNLVLAFLITLSFLCFPQQKKFLFDNTHAETAGNADWVIDEDNLVPGRYPTPDQSTVTSSTTEGYWTGALSSWGIALVKLGYHVETLPSGSSFTYGTSNAQDLKNYDVFVIDEPNTQFSSVEKTALINFVQNGGGLFMISDHTGSDRNNDGWDSPMIWNDLFTNNGIVSNPFGMSVDLVDISQTSSNVATGDFLTSGTAGTVSAMKWSDGATATLNPTANSSVTGVVWTTGTAHGNTNLMVARSKYGNGRVVLVCDSSPADDGTGGSGNTLYVGWADPSVGGSHANLHLNASIWLAKDSDLPVELTSFTSSVINDDVLLNWNTVTEINSLSFEVEKKYLTNEIWQIVASVKASGNSTSPKQYSYVDKKVNAGKFNYRLKILDVDGTFKYSPVILADISSPVKFELKQNYPNPFNPSTTIEYQLPVSSFVSLIVFDAVGKKILTLVNEFKPAGNYNIIFNGQGLSSDIYFYQMRTGNYIATKKLLLIK